MTFILIEYLSYLRNKFTWQWWIVRNYLPISRLWQSMCTTTNIKDDVNRFQMSRFMVEKKRYFLLLMKIIQWIANNISIIAKIKYSDLSNMSGVSNKHMEVCKFFDLLHKIARFRWFLANFCLQINRRGDTSIR